MHGTKRSMLLIAILATVILLFASLAYVPEWPDWTGFEGKGAWDVLELLIIPLTLSGIAVYFAFERDHAEASRQLENQRESALQTYMNRIEELVLERNLHTDDGNYAILARSYSLVVLEVLDGKRKGFLIQFLHEAGLLTRDSAVIYLGQANFNEAVLYRSFIHKSKAFRQVQTISIPIELRGIDLRNSLFLRADLRDVILDEACLWGANMLESDLTRASLRKADLRNVLFVGADLRSAYLSNADLRGARFHSANLEGADLSGANLRGTYFNSIGSDPLSKEARIHGASIVGAFYDDKTKWPSNFDPVSAGALLDL